MSPLVTEALSVFALSTWWFGLHGLVLEPLRTIRSSSALVFPFSTPMKRRTVTVPPAILSDKPRQRKNCISLNRPYLFG